MKITLLALVIVLLMGGAGVCEEHKLAWDSEYVVLPENEHQIAFPQDSARYEIYEAKPLWSFMDSVMLELNADTVIYIPKGVDIKVIINYKGYWLFLDELIPWEHRYGDDPYKGITEEEIEESLQLDTSQEECD